MAKDTTVRYIRIELTQQQHRQVRLAAAHNGACMAGFVRDTVLAIAAEEVEELKSSGTKSRSTRRRKKQARGQRASVAS